MNYKYILVLIFFFCLFEHSTAQVTIGSQKKPAQFSVLQLEGKTGGLRLPQLIEAKRNLIENNLFPTDKTQASGLMIFNTNTKKVEYWDGTKWTSSFDIFAQNGLYTDNLGLKLGGALIRATDIGLKNFDLKYIIRGSESFNLYNTTFDITGKYASLNTPALSIQNTASNILLYIGNETTKTKNVIVNSNGLGTFRAKSLNSTAKIEIVGDAEGNTTTITNKMEYKDSEANIEKGKALISEDNQGTARWADLRPAPKVVAGSFLVGSESPDINTQGMGTYGEGTKNITKTPLVLSPGKWLIFANIQVKAAEAAPTHDSRGSTVIGNVTRKSSVWLHLFDKKTATILDNDAIVVKGAFLEFARNLTTAYGKNRSAYISIVYMLDTNSLTPDSNGKFTIYAFASTWAAKNVTVQDTHHQFTAISIVDYEKL